MSCRDDGRLVWTHSVGMLPPQTAVYDILAATLDLQQAGAVCLLLGNS